MSTNTTYETLPASTRVWIYQSNDVLPEGEIPLIKAKIQQFAERWVSHNRQLRAYGDILHNRFLVLMVDESQAGASGCSIDSSVAFVKSLQAEYQVDFFDRMRFSFKQGDKVLTLSRDEFAKWYQEGRIGDDTLVFDTLVKDKAAFEAAFEKPLAESWHARMV